MKPVIYKTSVVLPLLVALTMFALNLGLLFSNAQIPVYPRVELQQALTGETNISIIWGSSSIYQMAAFVGFALLYLLQEFYGFRIAVGAVIACSSSLMLWLVIPNLFEILTPYLINPDTPKLIIGTLATLNNTVIKSSLAFLTFGLGGLCVNAALTKVTHHYLMVLRWIPSVLLGGLLQTSLSLFLFSGYHYTPRSILKMAIPETSPLLGFAIMLLIPLYVMRFVLSLIRGGQKITEVEDAGPMFAPQTVRAATVQTNPASQTATSPWQPPSAQQDDVTAKTRIDPQ